MIQSPHHISHSLLYRQPHVLCLFPPRIPYAHVWWPANHVPASSPLANHTQSNYSCPCAHITPLMNINPFHTAFTIQSTFGSGRTNSINYSRMSWFTKSDLTTWLKLVDQGRFFDPWSPQQKSSLIVMRFQTHRSATAPLPVLISSVFINTLSKTTVLRSSTFTSPISRTAAPLPSPEGAQVVQQSECVSLSSETAHQTQ